MDKQRNVLVELLLIFILIIGVSALVWHLTSYSPSAPPTAAPSDSKATDDNKPSIEASKDPVWLKGKELFKANCASCHNPKVAQTGPALMGVTKRWEDAGIYQGKTGKQWMYMWIKNWNSAVASGYPYAVHIQHYTESDMNTFPNLSDQDIDAILTYIEGSSTAPVKTTMP